MTAPLAGTRLPAPAVPAEAVPDRREFKFLVPAQLLPRLREVARSACELDHHAGPDGTYLVRTLYLDTFDMQLYKANEREQPDRFKARIRCYPSQPGSPVFFEIKRRLLDAIRKARVPVPPDRWRDYLRLDPESLGQAHRDEALSAFLSRLHAHHLEPRLLVEYRREAWKSRLQPYARLTFDMRIGACARRDWSLDLEPRCLRLYDHAVTTWTFGPVCVVEAKFSGAAPAWMSAMVRHLDLVRHAFSKYAYGIEAVLATPGFRHPSPRMGL